MTTSVKQVLVTARNLVKLGWVRETAAVDKDGLQVDPDSPEACKWCATGAIEGTGASYALQIKTNRALEKVLGGYSIVDFNDHVAGDKRAVLRKFDQAILSV